METKDFFYDLLEVRSAIEIAQLGEIAKFDITKELIDNLRTTITPELSRLKFYLMDRVVTDREIIIENVINSLLSAYYDTRSFIGEIGEADKEKANLLRGAMNLFYETILHVTSLSQNLRIKINSDFISNWENRASYFPFGDFMREGKPMPFINKASEQLKKPVEKERTIKEDELCEYFTPTFRGERGENTYNYFETLISDLRENRNDKEFARIALMIYKSGNMIKAKKKATFKDWYRTFCELVGCGFNKAYKPCNLQPTKDLEKKFSYIGNTPKVP